MLHAGDLLDPPVVLDRPDVHGSYMDLGIGSMGDVDALSSGLDAVQMYNLLFFSVDRDSMGIEGGPDVLRSVYGQADANQQAGDIFATVNDVPTYSMPLGMNYLETNQNWLGLNPRALEGIVYDEPGAQENLDALSFEEFDLSGAAGFELAVNFSVDYDTAMGLGISGADILTSTGDGSFTVWADHSMDIGLDVDDDIDALALLRLSLDGGPDEMMDLALFSLAPGSPALVDGGYSAADIFMTSFDGTYSLRYTADSLGLTFQDNVDALEVQAPEPMSLSLLAMGAGAVLLRRRR
jgi:hypothetical protein